MTEQQAVASPGGLGDWKPQEEWRRMHAGHLFETPDSWQWFMRTYRKELLEAGAIGLIAGRIFVHAERIEPAIERVLTTRAHRVYAPRQATRRPAEESAG